MPATEPQEDQRPAQGRAGQRVFAQLTDHQDVDGHHGDLAELHQHQRRGETESSPALPARQYCFCNRVVMSCTPSRTVDFPFGEADAFSKAARYEMRQGPSLQGVWQRKSFCAMTAHTICRPSRFASRRFICPNSTTLIHLPAIAHPSQTVLIMLNPDAAQSAAELLLKARGDHRKLASACRQTVRRIVGR